MNTNGTFKRIRTVAIAMALTFAANFTISQVVENGGAQIPLPPRPVVENGGAQIPLPPRPVLENGGAQIPLPPRP